MKKLTILLILLVTMSSLHAQVIVPENVKNSFTITYPAHKKVVWSKEDDLFEVEFTNGKLKMEAVYNESGELLEEETEVSKKDLPAGIQTYLKANYKSAEIEELVRKKSGTTITYEVELEQKEIEIELQFDSKGKFLSKKESKESEEEEED